MKQTKLFMLFLCIPFFLTFLSCDDDDNNGGGYNPKSFLPKKISNTGSSVSFSYDSKKRITEVIASTAAPSPDKLTNSTLPVSYKLRYNVEAKIDSMLVIYDESASIENDTILFAYDGQTITATGKNSTETINLNTNNKVSSYSYEAMDQAKTTLLFDYDDKGNISRINEEEILTYDDKNGIFKNVVVPQWFIVTQLDKIIYGYFDKFNINNNCVKYVDSDEKETEYLYMYNDMNFPTSREKKANDGTLEAINEYSEKIEYAILDF